MFFASGSLIAFLAGFHVAVALDNGVARLPGAFVSSEVYMNETDIDGHILLVLGYNSTLKCYDSHSDNSTDDTKPGMPIK